MYKKRGIALPLHPAAVFGALATLTVLAAACAPSADFAPGSSTPLAAFDEAEVRVAVSLERTLSGDFLLTATFTPLRAGFHLYSKDIPAKGIDGVGRPTLLALPADSALQASGPLTENLAPQTPPVDPRELLIYPAGPVILSLPVNLPAGDKSQKIEILVTYMSCNGTTCLRPVIQKAVSVQVPGADQIPPLESLP